MTSTKDDGGSRGYFDILGYFFCFAGGIIIGGIFTGRVEQILIVMAEVMYHRSWIIITPVTVIIAGIFLIKYFNNVETIRIETSLTRGYKNQLRQEIENKMAAKIHKAKKTTQSTDSHKKRLQQSLARIIDGGNQLQQDQANFLHFVEQINNLLHKRSIKLQKEIPDNPISLEKILERDIRLHEQLNDTLHGICETFPDLKGSVPVLNPVLRKPQELPATTSDIVVLEKEKEQPKSGRVPEYKKRKLKRRSRPR